jgi:MFS family permease
MSERSYKSFLRNYYLASFFYDFIFAYAIYNLLFSRQGLSVFQISLLLAWWALSSFVLEIPSGALADYWSRRGMLVLAPPIKAVCFLVWLLSGGNFYLYALGFFFWSLGSSLVSGTSEALLYDHLVFYGKRSDYEKALGRKRFYYFIAMAISGITGGFMAHYNLNWPLLSSIVPLAFSAGFAFLIEDTPKAELTRQKGYLEYMRLAYTEIRANTLLVFFVLYFLGITVSYTLEEFDQLYYDLAGLPIFAFGIASFIWSLLGAAGSFYAYKFKNMKWVFYIFPLASAGLLFVVGVSPSIPIIGLLLLSYFIWSPLRVLIDGRIQRSIKSVSRATVTSVCYSLMNLVGVVITPIFGLISRRWNLQAIYVATGFFLLFFSGWVFLKRRNFQAAEAAT